MDNPVPTDTTILHVMAGGPHPLTADGEKSAIRKDPVLGRATVGKLGLTDDHHVYSGHGGPEKAILQCAREHYDTYRRRFPEFVADIDGPRRGFGENISAEGMTEESVCIGDLYRIGPSVDESLRAPGGITVEVVGFRQPCWKLGYNCGVREVPRIMQDDGTTGWYYRVVSEGTIAAGDKITRIDRPYPEWPVGDTARRFYGTPLDPTFLRDALALEPLAENLKAIVRTRLATGTVEEWDSRLYR